MKAVEGHLTKRKKNPIHVLKTSLQGSSREAWDTLREGGTVEKVEQYELVKTITKYVINLFFGGGDNSALISCKRNDLRVSVAHWIPPSTLDQCLLLLVPLNQVNICLINSVYLYNFGKTGLTAVLGLLAIQSIFVAIHKGDTPYLGWGQKLTLLLMTMSSFYYLCL